ncbi:MAG: endo-1,4-beta-xylanase [Patescibacteria group bacterium]
MTNFLLRHKKSLVIIFIVIIVIGILIFFIFTRDFSNGKKQVYGVTFSKKYALELKLDWQKTYLAILNDLKVNNIRLIAYWDEIEEQRGSYDFFDLDWQISQAEPNGTKIILVVGRRTPRWPECHDPAWVGNLSSSATAQAQLDFVRTVINRYKNNSLIQSWQVENEPMLSVFGQCPSLNQSLLRQEIDLVKSLDARPIIITDSGELGDWQHAASQADILGSTMYRIVWNQYLGFWDYFFLPPAFYHYKAEITKYFHPNLKQVIITELQMEPWTFNQPMISLSLADQKKSFNLQRFVNNISYAKRTGLSQVYLWGVEYWYWQKQQGNDELWQQAQKLWQ